MPFTNRCQWIDRTASLDEMKLLVKAWREDEDYKSLGQLYEYTQVKLDDFLTWANKSTLSSEAVRCNDCTDFVSDSEASEYDGEWYCEDCNNNYGGCDHCGARVHDDNACYASDTRYCEHCFSRFFRTCDYCEEPAARDDMCNEFGHSFCSYCYEESYGDIVDRFGENDSDGESEDEDSPRLRRVYNRHWEEQCSPFRSIEDAYNTLKTDDGYLKWGTDVMTIHKPGKGDKRDGLMLGVELEVETTGEILEAVKQCRPLLDEFAIMKHDGSLTQGFEIVTKPMGLNEMKAAFLPFFEGRPKKLRSYDTGRCGMHVHVSRKNLSFVRGDETNTPTGDFRTIDVRPVASDGYLLESGVYNESYLQMWKIWKFLSKDENYTFVRKIAQRSLKCDPEIDEENREEATHYATVMQRLRPRNTWRHGGERNYCAFNWAPNHTVEYRLFQGTLYYPSFCKSLEFAHALVKFTMAGNVSLEEATSVKRFLQFVQAARQIDDNGTLAPTYPYLMDFLKSKGFIKFKKRSKTVAAANNRKEEYAQCA